MVPFLVPTASILQDMPLIPGTRHTPTLMSCEAVSPVSAHWQSWSRPWTHRLQDMRYQHQARETPSACKKVAMTSHHLFVGWLTPVPIASSRAIST